MKGQVATNGSGLIITGFLILTNAHVVTNDISIQVRRAGRANKYHAVVRAIDFESDLAILSMDKKNIFQGVKPLDFGEFAEVRDKLAVYGFPNGDDKLSITEGGFHGTISLNMPTAALFYSLAKWMPISTRLTPEARLYPENRLKLTL